MVMYAQYLLFTQIHCALNVLQLYMLSFLTIQGYV